MSLTENKIPLLLFAQSEEDACYLSLLLSNHLHRPGMQMNSNRAMTVNHHFLRNPAIDACLQFYQENPSAVGFGERLALLLEEGFDTGNLLGLSLPMWAFASLAAKRWTEKAVWIFVYNEGEEWDDKDSSVMEAALRFVKTKLHSCLVINARSLSSWPFGVLQQICSKWTAEIVHPEIISPGTKLNNTWWLQKQGKVIPEQMLESFRELSILSPIEESVGADNLLFIFYAISAQQQKNLWYSILDLCCLFVHSIQIKIYCTDEQTMQAIHAQAALYEKGFFRIEIFLQNSLVPEMLNQLVHEHPHRYYLISDLQLRFNFPDLLKPANQSLWCIAFAALLRDEHERPGSLSDILVKEQPMGNMFFSREVFQKMGGFDSLIEEDAMLWDFAIRSVSVTGKPARILPAKLMHDHGARVFSHKDSAYKQVLRKHQSLLENCLHEVLQLASSETYQSKKETLQLHEKIFALQQMSVHTKDELKALQQLTSQLQQRIRFLEGNWYMQLRVKLGRIKKIFFKKKSPGSGTLKRMLQFIRFTLSRAGFGILRKIAAAIFKKLYLVTEYRDVEILYKGQMNGKGIFTYHDWMIRKLEQSLSGLALTHAVNKLPYRPLISILMPVYNTPLKYLKEAIESVLAQGYTNWELCIADDCSTIEKVRKMLHVYAVKDSRIKVHYRDTNGHISRTSNDALKLATGDFVLLMDHDDLLTSNCLWELVQTLNVHPRAEIIYSDEDKMDEAGIFQQAHFKPDWAPDHLLSRNYIGHVSVLKKTLMDRLGGFRIGFEGSQDYDLMLRATELTNEIVHIPKVLYHWRIHALSAAQGEEVKPYAYIAAKKALEEALLRRGLKGEVKYLAGLRGYRIEYEIQQPELVSIIIPTKDQVALLKNTIDSIIQKTSYKHYEIIVLNNNSTTTEFADWTLEYSQKYANILSVADAHFPFNFSRLMNMGAALSKGEHLLMLNNDVEVIHEDWLEIMLSYSQQTRIGAVGVRLLYPDDTIQHAGVIVGLGGIAGHTFVGAHREEAGYFNYIQSVNNYTAVTAACLMCRKSVFREVDGMDEQFEVEYNDVDFCIRVMKAGYNNVYLPQVELYHYESATRGHPHQSKPSYERHLKEMKLFKDKWQVVIDKDPYYNPNLNLGVHDFSMDFSV